MTRHAGIDCLGADLVGRGGGGRGGGHGGHGHGGHHRGGGRNWWGPGWGWWDGPDYELEDVVVSDVERCLATDADGNCVVWAPSAVEVVGMTDIAAAQRQMNGLKPVTVRVGQALLKGGMAAIDGAVAQADLAGLPGPTARKNVRDHLRWHADALGKLSSTPNALYAPGEDLKSYTMRAYIEANSVEEGAAYLDALWGVMWREIGEALAALPKEVREALAKAASGAIETITGIPVWGWAVIGVTVVGGLGYLAFKLLDTRAAQGVGSGLGRAWGGG